MEVELDSMHKLNNECTKYGPYRDETWAKLKQMQKTDVRSTSSLGDAPYWLIVNCLI